MNPNHSNFQPIQSNAFIMVQSKEKNFQPTMCQQPQNGQKSSNLQQNYAENKIIQCQGFQAAFTGNQNFSESNNLMSNNFTKLPGISQQCEAQNYKQKQQKSSNTHMQQNAHVLDFTSNQQNQQNPVQLIPSKGGCTPEERHQKIQKYLEKRKRRTYDRKISYDCRKKVADNRIRVKGRFVNKKTAELLLSQNGNVQVSQNESLMQTEEFKTISENNDNDKMEQEGKE